MSACIASCAAVSIGFCERYQRARECKVVYNTSAMTSAYYNADADPHLRMSSKAACRCEAYARLNETN